jgi:hypothetical protein
MRWLSDDVSIKGSSFSRTAPAEHIARAGVRYSTCSASSYRVPASQPSKMRCCGAKRKGVNAQSKRGDAAASVRGHSMLDVVFVSVVVGVFLLCRGAVAAAELG